MFYETALKADARRRIREVGQADIVVGIPSYRNAKTIGHVMQTIAQGLSHYYRDMRTVILDADGDSTDNTIEVARGTAVPRGVYKIVTKYQGLVGKGSAVRAAFEITRALGARVCAIVDADLKNITPEWVDMLVRPILNGDYDYVLPYYSYPTGEATINRNLAYPLIRMLFGHDVYQPLGGEVAVSGEIAHYFVEKDVWETDVSRYGIYPWMTVLAINEGWRICQVSLGARARAVKDPVSGFEPRFLQVVGTIFRLLSIYRRLWPTQACCEQVPFWGEKTLVEPQPISDATNTILEAIRKGVGRHRWAWQSIMTAENFAAVDEVISGPPGAMGLPPELWAKVVLDFAVVYNKGEGDPDKVVLSLLPLYYVRMLGFMAETRGRPYHEVEEVVQHLAKEFEAHKSYLLDRWETYVPWGARRFQ